MKKFYMIMCVLGTVLPLSQLYMWIMENGVNPSLVFEDIVTDKLSAFAWLDVIVSAVTLIGFILWDSRKNHIKYAWCSILGTYSGKKIQGHPLYRKMMGELFGVLDF